MSKPDMNQIEFHATVGIDREEIKLYKGDDNLITRKQEYQARDLGLLIAKTKGWKTEPINNMHVSKLDVYVFTRNELKDFVDAEIKRHLILMSERV